MKNFNTETSTQFRPIPKLLKKNERNAKRTHTKNLNKNSSQFTIEPSINSDLNTKVHQSKSDFDPYGDAPSEKPRFMQRVSLKSNRIDTDYS